MKTDRLLTTLLSFLACAHAGTVAGPNLVILLADDWGWGDPSPPLGAGVSLMPELNAMAQAPGAAHFVRSYIGGSVCSPSRATILTGRTCTRDCVINVERTALPLQLQGNTLADVAKARGYATFFAGAPTMHLHAHLLPVELQHPLLLIDIRARTPAPKLQESGTWAQ